MRIGKIASNAEYRMGENPKLPIFGAAVWLFKLKKF